GCGGVDENARPEVLGGGRPAAVLGALRSVNDRRGPRLPDGECLHGVVSSVASWVPVWLDHGVGISAHHRAWSSRWTVGGFHTPRASLPNCGVMASTSAVMSRPARLSW